MTGPMMDLRPFAVERLMELEVGAKTGADYREKIAGGAGAQVAAAADSSAALPAISSIPVR